jgi:hypothetical protein
MVAFGGGMKFTLWVFKLELGVTSTLLKNLILKRGIPKLQNTHLAIFNIMNIKIVDNVIDVYLRAGVLLSIVAVIVRMIENGNNPIHFIGVAGCIWFSFWIGLTYNKGLK